MSELAIQRFLRTGGTPLQLLESYSIKARAHGRYPNLLLLKYDQLASPFSEEIVRQCRGIILDRDRDWAVVSRAFDKFGNLGEGYAATIDWPTARVQEKLDGSLVVLYAYDGAWHVATSGTPDASGNLHGGASSFAEYFWAAFEASGATLPSLDCGACFYFEITGPKNRIVVVYERVSLTLLGARDLRTQKELDLDDAHAFFREIPSVRSFTLASWEAIAETFGSMSPLSQEGYVVVDAAFNRVKVKHPGYVALRHAKDGLGPKAFVEIARSGETSEVVIAFPEYAPLMRDAKAKVDQLVADIERDFARIRGIEEQKAFALEATKTRCGTALFQLRSGRAENARAFVRDMRIQSLMQLLGVEDVEPAKTVEEES